MTVQTRTDGASRPVRKMHPNSRTRTMVYRVLAATGDALDLAGIEMEEGSEGDPMFLQALQALANAYEGTETWCEAATVAFGNLTPPERLLFRSSRLPATETLAIAADLLGTWYDAGSSGRGRE